VATSGTPLSMRLPLGADLGTALSKMFITAA
jgi:hypothetical protein